MEIEKHCEKKSKGKVYILKIKISAKKRREITACAKIKDITVNQFIKDAINQCLINCKMQYDNSVLRNQLELFNIEEYFKNGTQLNIEL